MPSEWLSLPAFAKINPSLELLGPRPDGYWQIQTLYQTITLHDRLRLRLTRTHARILVRVPGGGAPPGPANLVYRLLRQARRFLGLRRGVEVELEKNIPPGRGLGGGSSDAAAALVGLLRLARTSLSPQEAFRLGGRAGADVPFFFLGGHALGVGRGEEVYPLEDAQPAYAVLVCPPYAIPTRTAYAWASRAYRNGRPTRGRRLTSRRPPAIIGRSSPVAESSNWLWATGNDFEPVLFPRFPELARMKAALLRAGAHHAGLSGSGSAVYALFRHRALANRAAAAWAPAAAVFRVETLPRLRYQQALGLASAVTEG